MANPNRITGDWLADRGYWLCCGEYRLPTEATCRHCHAPKPGTAAVPPAIRTGRGATSTRTEADGAAPGQETARKTTQHGRRGKWAPYRSYTEKRAADRLAEVYGAARVRYEAIRVRLADGAWYTPDFLALSGDMWAYEVKNAAHDAHNSLATQRRVLRVAAERLAELGIELRLLVWDGKAFTEQEV